MRHRVKGVKLGRDTAQRKSLFKNLLSSLFMHGEIQTTEAKAKAIKGIADKLISRASAGTMPARRLISQFFGTRAVANRLVDEVAPAMKDRTSGFTRIIRLGKRMGDDSMMVKMELITKPVVKEVIQEAPVVQEAVKVQETAKPKAAAAKKKAVTTAK